ncbi:MAG: glycerol kinase, partial [Solirubrobacteraceae bacterium]|nr:glycerol kinase [Solirubrobacteraceae bacterium]
MQAGTILPVPACSSDPVQPPCGRAVRVVDSFPVVILAIDQGTTGTTCLVFDAGAQLVGRSYREFRQHFPRPGWIEHDAGEIWEATRAVALEAL